jgi:hypothetical protein
MPVAPLPAVTLTPVAYFPEGYVLENLAVRADGSVLVTTAQKKELWCVPGPEPRTEVPAVLVHTFEHLILGIAEAEPDVFIVNLSDIHTTHESHLARVDLNGWTQGKPVSPEIIFTFDDRVRGLKGSTMLCPDVLAVSDCFAGLIWRVGLSDGARTGYLYYTSTAQKVFMRVPVDQASLDPAGDPELVAEIDPTPRLSLADPDNTTEELAEAFKLLPVINVFRALANAKTLYPTYRTYSEVFGPWAGLCPLAT